MKSFLNLSLLLYFASDMIRNHVGDTFKIYWGSCHFLLTSLLLPSSKLWSTFNWIPWETTRYISLLYALSVRSNLNTRQELSCHKCIFRLCHSVQSSLMVSSFTQSKNQSPFKSLKECTVWPLVSFQISYFAIFPLAATLGSNQP